MICIIHTIFTELYKQKLQDNSFEKEWVILDLLLSQETHLLATVSMLKIGLEIMLQLLNNLNTQSDRFSHSVCSESHWSELTSADSLITQHQSSVHDGHNLVQCILSSETTMQSRKQDKNSIYSQNTKLESKRVSLKDTL